MTQINGPVNILRLNGNIKDIQKIVYIFIDKDLKKFTSCEDKNAIDITKYIKDNFKQLKNNQYDFFAEFSINTKIVSSSDYLNSILRFFSKYYKINEMTNKIEISNKFPNIHFHYIDISDWLKYYIKQCIGLFAKEKHQNNHDIQEILKYIIDFLYYLKGFLQNPSIIAKPIIKNLESQVFNELVLHQYLEYIKYLIGKMLLKYNNENIRILINEYINIILIRELDYIIKKIKKLNDNFNINKLQNINIKYIVPFFDQLMNIYFLRRLLDKKYITNSVIYLSENHAAICVNILINLFNFTLTNIANNKNSISNINRLVKYFHPFQAGIHYQDIITTMNNILMNNTIQCSNISKLPSNFT